MLVVNLHHLFGQYTFQKLCEFTRVIKFLYLGFIGALTKHSSHEIRHHLGQGSQTRGFLVLFI